MWRLPQRELLAIMSCLCVMQEQYREIYELAAYHLSTNKLQNEKAQDEHVYANMSRLWEAIFDLHFYWR